MIRKCLCDMMTSKERIIKTLKRGKSDSRPLFPGHTFFNKVRLYALFVLIAMFICISCSENLTKENSIEKSKDGHSLLKNGKPFFWLGDTGWFLFTQPPSGIDSYFRNRMEQQFNVIQLMVTNRRFNEPEFMANYKGDLPFESLDPVKLNESYFAYIDTIVRIAQKYDLILAMAPTWGPVLDQIFSVDDPAKAFDYAYLLGKRYKAFRNVVWIVCGEYHKVAWETEKSSEDPDESELVLIENLAKGLEEGHKGANLMTIHPTGWRSSSEHFHDSDWLDFNMVQSWKIGIGTELDIINDYRMIPYKPTILAEPGYEFGGAGHKAFQVRYEGYHSVINGGFGYTYGCEGVWNFSNNWKDLLNSEGTLQMKYMRKLFESRPLHDRIPAPEMIKGCPGNWMELTKPAAARADNGSYAFIYFPSDTLRSEIRISEISGKKANAWWYNPQDGDTYDAEGIKTNRPFAQFPCNLHQSQVFDPPGNEGTGKDWILVLDDADHMFGKP